MVPPWIDGRGNRRRLRGRLVDGRGSWRRMRGRLDVVERERQGQGSIFVCRRVPFCIYSLALQGIQDRD